MYCSVYTALKFDVGAATDAVEASALGYKGYYIDVYSNSWGPSDFGFIVLGPETLLQRTLATGVTEVCRVVCDCENKNVYRVERTVWANIKTIFSWRTTL